jgi:NNP family nitrate/nitrite transporter-like MFS transporter
MKGFLRAGHFPTLTAALLYFDVSFMTWVLLGPLAPFLREDMGLTATQQGLVTAIPLLGGSLFRPLLGMLGDRIGGRRTGMIGMTLTLITLAAGWQFASTAAHLYGLGLMLGIAGASFAVALPLASRWYPPEYQGLAMGIAGAGNSGTLLATLFAPRLAERYGWASTLGLAIVPLLAVFVLFALMARDSPKRPAPATLADYRALLREPDTLAMAFLYSLTFGGFVGLASFLPTYFHEQYHLSRVAAGDVTTVVVVSGSLLRPIGGWLSDRLGGYRLLVILLAGFALCLGVVATGVPMRGAVALFFVGLGMLGMGNGAVFQLVPQRFPERIGIVTGIVGAAGGLGGFFLPSALGAIRDEYGTYAPGLALFTVAFVVGTIVLLELGHRWSRRWNQAAIRQTGVYTWRAPLRGSMVEEQ